ncbi:uncharacterized protein KGF55_004659 [Candida pseudojiufengensis]|uniref:uncharacterized protein n=1 Tax=Candida pseudojiufengensis TaxID=497109 RepID=UPI002224ADCD|nr:uncharacterized protein KGF55_004659 [Candida pseudojiufengensis]KAI5960367.1 hypothetical protein KGF55_004659 [Candida pseudojiufengensis]
MSSVANLFIDKTQAPKKEDQGIINIGKNCSYCSQLDFLPFHCEFCDKTFCSQHRTLEKHQCPNKDKFYNQSINTSNSSSTTSSSTISSKSLFPDREADRKLINERLKSPEPTTIKETQFRVGDVAGTNAFKKFQEFLNLKKSKQKNSSSVSKIFGKSSSASKFADIAKLKKDAKGDNKIKQVDRVYVWCIYVKDPKSIEQAKQPVFISKNWVIGKSLDNIAETLKLSNYNNSTTNASEKLNIFTFNQQTNESKQIENSKKSNILQNGDIIYLVRGTI